MKYSVEQKAKALDENWDDVEKRLSRKAFLDLDEDAQSEWFKLLRDEPLFGCAHQLNVSRKQKIWRLRDRITPVINSGNAIFCTLTFTDDVLSNTSAETRRRYVSRFFKALCRNMYVGNIDFGDKEKNPDSKEREHYHGITFFSEFVQKHKKGVPDDINQTYLQSLWPYGWSTFETIGSKNRDKTKISKYVCKLSSHSYKPSCGSSRLIYSRDTDEKSLTCANAL